MNKSLQKFSGEKMEKMERHRGCLTDSCEDMKEEIWRDYNKDWTVSPMYTTS